MENYREIFLMQQTYATLFALANKVQAHGDKRIKDLTSRQFMAMMAIIHLPGSEATLNKIAGKLGTTKQSVKQLITILESKGYVTVQPSKHDKRAVNVSITKSGQQIMIKCNERGMSCLLDLFHEFSKEEMEILWSLLKKLYHFDGEEQDGFEEDWVLELSEAEKKKQTTLLNEFIKRRNLS